MEYYLLTYGGLEESRFPISARVEAEKEFEKLSEESDAKIELSKVEVVIIRSTE